MSRITRARRHTRTLALVGAVATGAVLFSAGPASAHVEVGSEKAQALAENVTLEFDAESESDTAGITELRVVLPEGIAPGDVTYDEGPKGWKFTANDDGYTVKGPAVKVGENAEYSVVVRQLPDAKELAFKTLQTYSDKRVDRWIELGEGSETPAPVLKLKAAAPDAKPISPSESPSDSASPSASVSEAADEPSSSPAASADQNKDDDGGLGTGAWIGIGAAVVVVAGGAAYLVRRRSSAQS
ncbi:MULTISPECIES: DUF1775 domain-containing protein [unclassified Streptomyces]|uniref:DUF1775 domain-containing protein n=1 Tax=unclassified Streptomyces TaxID=2593676 RepID=UPI002E187100|nr:MULTISPECIES: DUF1775 domain-containing protein [unclassified Streptomyces]